LTGLGNTKMLNADLLTPQTKALQFPFAIFAEKFAAFWRRLLRICGPAPKSLRLCENLPLGERRFVAVVEFERARFLIGGTASTLVLLSRLGDAKRASRTKTAFDKSRTGNEKSAIGDLEPGHEQNDREWEC
jgi:hypothetical protein